MEHLETKWHRLEKKIGLSLWWITKKVRLWKIAFIASDLVLDKTKKKGIIEDSRGTINWG